MNESIYFLSLQGLLIRDPVVSGCYNADISGPSARDAEGTKIASGVECK
jgi:hypothetical protein